MYNSLYFNTYISNPSEIVSNPSEIVSNPSEIVSNPSDIVSNPSGIVSNPSEIVSNPSGIITTTSYILSTLLDIIIIYSGTISTYSDIVYKTEGSSNDDSDKGDGAGEEESFEIEEEIQDIERLMKLSNNAMILDEKLPYSEKEKNSHLNDLRKDPSVKEFFEGKTPNVSDLPELNKALVESRNEKKKELSEAKNYANDQSSRNSLNDRSDSGLDKSNNFFYKQDYNNDYEYKLGNTLLDIIIEILKKFF